MAAPSLPARLHHSTHVSSVLWRFDAAGADLLMHMKKKMRLIMTMVMVSTIGMSPSSSIAALLSITIAGSSSLPGYEKTMRGRTTEDHR